MKWTHGKQRESDSGSTNVGVKATQQDSLRQILTRTKQRVLRDYAEFAGEHLNVLKLALNEAEGIAWSTGYPQLFFPTLAMEKAQSAVVWHQRQRALRHATAEIAFAE